MCATQRPCAHGIGPLLYHTMQHLGLTGMLPPEALEILQRVSYATVAPYVYLPLQPA